MQSAAVENRPELRAGAAEVARASSEIEVMRAMYRPMMTIRTGPSSTMAEGPGAMIMIGVSVPIWRERLRSGVAEAVAMEGMARADLEAMRRMIEGEAVAAREGVNASRIRWDALRKEVVPRARMAVEAALAAYSAGRSTLVPVIESSRALWDVRSELVMADRALGRGVGASGARGGEQRAGGAVRPGLDSRLRVAAVTAAVVVVALGALLLLQDFRHGWPFSRHHATPGERASQPAPAAVTGQVSRAAARSPVEVDSARLEALGVRFEPVAVEVIAEPVRAVATVVADEARISHVHTRVSGWLEQLFVNTTGQQVRAGEPLAAVFSQELYASQNEYLSLLRLAQDAPPTAALEAGRTRLELLGMTAAEIAEIERTGQARRLVTIVVTARRRRAASRRECGHGSRSLDRDRDPRGPLSGVGAGRGAPSPSRPVSRRARRRRSSFPAIRARPVHGARRLLSIRR